MYCKKCGTEIPEIAEFCPKCGTEAPREEDAASEEEIEEVALGGHPSDSMPVIEETSGDEPASKADTEPLENRQAPRDEEQDPKEPSDASEAQDDESGTTMPLEGGSAAAAQSQTPKPRISRRSRPLIAAAVAAVAFIAIAVGAGTWLKSDQEAQAVMESAWEASHVSLITQVVAEVPGFDESATAIPVQIKGTDLDGNEVDEVQYLRPGAMYITTLPGSYDVTFPGGYFTGDGRVIKAPDVTQHIEVEAPSSKGELSDRESKAQTDEHDNDSSDESASNSGSSKPSESKETVDDQELSSESAPARSDQRMYFSDDDEDDDEIYDIPTKFKPVVYVEVPALEVTDELISMIASWAKDDPEDTGKATLLMEMATTKHVEAVAAEEARKAAEGEAPAAEETVADNASPSQPSSSGSDAPAASTPSSTPEPAAPATEAPAPAVEQPAPATETPAQTPSTSQDDAYQYYLDQRQRMTTG